MLLDVTALNAIRGGMRSEIEIGLENDDGQLHMIPSFVPGIPNGTGILTNPRSRDPETHSWGVTPPLYSPSTPHFMDRAWASLSESGVFFGIDLGGTSYRVARVALSGGEQDVHIEGGLVPRPLYTGHVDALFDFLAQQLRSVMRAEDAGQRASVGFAFSFPMRMLSNCRDAVLLYWTKGYACSGAEGRCIADLMQSALARQGLPHKGK